MNTVRPIVLPHLKDPILTIARGVSHMTLEDYRTLDYPFDLIRSGLGSDSLQRTRPSVSITVHTAGMFVSLSAN